MSENWLLNKIKGNFAETVFEYHFREMGYDVDKIGIENIALNYERNLKKIDHKIDNIAPKCKQIYNKIKNNIQKLPDFIVSKCENGKFYVLLFEVKYRNDVDNLLSLEAELFWKYRYSIWTKDFLDELKRNGIKIECDNLEESSKQSALQIFKEQKEKNKITRIPLIFYVIIGNPTVELLKSYEPYEPYKKKEGFGIKKFY